MVEMLSVLGFQIRFKPKGSVFVFAELPAYCQISDASPFLCLLLIYQKVSHCCTKPVYAEKSYTGKVQNVPQLLSACMLRCL